MSDNIHENNVYSLKQRVWHNKGRIGQENETALQVYSQMSPVDFVSRPFSVSLNGGVWESNKHFAIIRTGTDGEKIIGQTKGRYVLTQPLTYCQLFDSTVGKPVETLGFLGTDGDRMFITWDLPFIDVHGDKVQTYGFLAVGYDGMYGEHLYVTNVRVICANTWNAAVSDSESSNNRGRGSLYSGKHNQTNHEKVLGIWMNYITKDAEEHVKLYQNLFCKMQETKIDTSVASNLFSKVYPLKDSLGSFYPDELRTKKEESIEEFNRKQTESQDLAMSLFKGVGIEISPTVWGAFNSVTEAENHHKKSKKDETFSILLGNRHNIMENAMNVMCEYVERQ